MSRRKQARPIRVLESEDGSNNLAALNLSSSMGNSEADSGSENSNCESENEENYDTKILEEEDLSENGIATNAFFDRLKSNSTLEKLCKVVESDKKRIIKEDALLVRVATACPKAEYEETATITEDEEADPEAEADVKAVAMAEQEQEREQEQEMTDAEERLCKSRTKAPHEANDTTAENLRKAARRLKERVREDKSNEENDDNNNNSNANNYDEPEDHSQLQALALASAAGPPPPPPPPLPPLNYNLPTSHVTLEALQNTKVAVAQFAATALANSADNPAALQEFAVLQSHLYQLQHQHLMHINIIHQLQQQLKITRNSATTSNPSSSPTFAHSEFDAVNLSPSNAPIPLVVTRPSSPSPNILTPPKSSRTPTPVKQETALALALACGSPPTSQPLYSSANASASASNSQPHTQSLKMCGSPSVSGSQQTQQPSTTLPPCSISSSFASSIITNLDPPPSPSEPNTLEMLQKRAQEVLDNASQGLLANNLADELAFRKSGASAAGGKGSALSPYDSKTGARNEPFFKHRCRYCGKVFGSDSALQIHIRSHTGERPFKCNVCGSRFTTKGNLKVHFQRHTSKFPHIKMNPNPVPEHLDKYHPPLLAQLNNHQNLPSAVASPHISHHIAVPLTSPNAAAAAAAATGSSGACTNTGNGSQQFPPVGATFPNSLSQLYRSSQLHHELPLPSHMQQQPQQQQQQQQQQQRLSQDALLKPFVQFSSFFGSQANEQDQPENLCKSASSNHSYSPPSLSEHGEHKHDHIEDEDTRALSETSDTTNDYNGVGDTVEGTATTNRSLIVASRVFSDELSRHSVNRDSRMDCDEIETDDDGAAKTAVTTNNDRAVGADVDADVDADADANMDMDSDENDHDDDDDNHSHRHRYHHHRNLGDHDHGDYHDRDRRNRDRDRSNSPYEECSVGSKYSNDDQRSPAMVERRESLADSNVTMGNHREESYQEQPENLSNKIRGNTTCNICYKTFACNSALEIHYRSHTKERPFKCSVCDRGFSTKGNMKQHMLTHKIRDMPSHLFEKSSPGSVSVPSSLVDETSNTSTDSKDPLQPINAAAAAAAAAAGLRCVPIESLTTSLQKTSVPPTLTIATAAENAINVSSQKRSPDSDSTLPVPKRQPSLPKHLCQVCNKNFSSSSALQIHMRTHTGDKPFRCSVCLKAFTTKGNLKVHMGTHMWTNGASRRGRRMSLELPSLPLTNKEPQTDLFHRRPDLFYPYLPTPFLNGVHQKLNEMSTMQNVSNNLTNGFFPFGGYTGPLNELKRSTSPVSPPLPNVNRHLNSDSHSVPSPWNLHFERKTMDESVETCTPSPPHQPQHQPHGEGLAA